MTSNLFASYRVRDYLQQVAISELGYLERISQEYKIIGNQKIFGTCKECEKPQNIEKNRFPDIKCWDSSRVHLLTAKGNSNFIHANYVHGFNCVRKFILTQEPMNSTLEDYWNMVWQEKTRVIVMPNDLDTIDESSTTDDSTLITFKLTATNIIVHEDFIKTIINVYNLITGQSRTVHHLMFINQSKGDSTDIAKFLDFVLLVNKQQQYFINKTVADQQPLPGPIIVYCSTGTGSAAIFCAIDVCVCQIVDTKLVSVPTVTLEIRQQRHSSIETLDQYFFINNAIVLFLSLSNKYPIS